MRQVELVQSRALRTRTQSPCAFSGRAQGPCSLRTDPGVTSLVSHSPSPPCFPLGPWPLRGHKFSVTVKSWNLGSTSRLNGWDQISILMLVSHLWF